MKENKFIIVGAPRTGTSVICSILNNSGANFGFDNHKAWDRASGDFEHPLLISNYKYLKRRQFFTQFSDQLARWHDQKIQTNLQKILSQVAFIKYPPLCELLPKYIHKLGYNPQLIVIIREFNDFAFSYLSKENCTITELENIYIQTYKTSLISLLIYGGSIVLYNDLIDKTKTKWAKNLAEYSNVPYSTLIEERDKAIHTLKSPDELSKLILSTTCDELYKTYEQYKDVVFSISTKHKMA